jgi:uncharacterized protein
MRHRFARIAGWLALLVPLCAAAQVAVPPLETRVTDLTATLTAQQVGELEGKLAAFEARKGSQIALLIVPTTRPESIEQYSIRVAEQWQLGRKGVDDGALLLIAKDDRELRIEVGYGLEGVLTDLVANRIVEDIIVPNLRAGDFYRGVSDGLDAMIRVVDGEPLPAPSRVPRQRRDTATALESLLMIGFVMVFVVGGVLRSLFGRLPAALLAGGATGAIAAVLLGSLPVGLLVAVAAFLFALLAGAAGLGRRSYGRGGWGGGWSGGGWSGGGGGGGGWSGGGGGFGGGGASGRW